jgi:hypothetical protein
LASVEQLTERLLYRLSLDMHVPAVAERLLHRFPTPPVRTPSCFPLARRRVFTRRLPCRPGLTKRAEITRRTKLNVMDCSSRRCGDEMNIPGRLNGIVSRQTPPRFFRVVPRYRATRGRIASFGRHGDSGIGLSSRSLKLAATCADPNYEKLPVTVSISNDISDYMKFSERLGSATLEPPRTAKWLFDRVLGHPCFVAFTSPRILDQYHFTSSPQLWPFVFSSLEHSKLDKDPDDHTSLIQTKDTARPTSRSRMLNRPSPQSMRRVHCDLV